MQHHFLVPSAPNGVSPVGKRGGSTPPPPPPPVPMRVWPLWGPPFQASAKPSPPVGPPPVRDEGEAFILTQAMTHGGWDADGMYVDTSFDPAAFVRGVPNIDPVKTVWKRPSEVAGTAVDLFKGIDSNDVRCAPVACACVRLWAGRGEGSYAVEVLLHQLEHCRRNLYTRRCGLVQGYIGRGGGGYPPSPPPGRPAYAQPLSP